MDQKIFEVIEEVLAKLPDPRKSYEWQIIAKLAPNVSFKPYGKNIYFRIALVLYRAGAISCCEYFIKSRLKQADLSISVTSRLRSLLVWVLALQARYQEAREILLPLVEGPQNSVNPLDILLLSFVESRAQDLTRAKELLKRSRKISARIEYWVKHAFTLQEAYICIEEGFYDSAFEIIHTLKLNILASDLNHQNHYILMISEYLLTIRSFYAAEYKDAAFHLEVFSKYAYVSKDPYFTIEIDNLRGALLVETSMYNQGESMQLFAIENERKLLSREEEINSYFHLGELKLYLGALQEANDYFSLCLRRSQELLLDRAGPYWGLASCFAEMGQYNSAHNILEDGLRVAAKTKRFFWLLRLLLKRAEIAFQVRDLGTLNRSFLDICKLTARNNSPEFEIYRLRISHLLHTINNEYILVDKDIRSIINTSMSIQNRIRRVKFLLETTQVCLDSNQYELVEQILESCLLEISDINSSNTTSSIPDIVQATYLRLRGSFLCRQGDYSGSEKELRHSLEIYEKTAVPMRDSAKLREILAELLMSTGRLSEAETVLQSARNIYRIIEDRVPLSYWRLIERLSQLMCAEDKLISGGKNEVITIELFDHSLMIAGPRTRQVLEIARQYAKSVRPILILGESGSGKEVIAKYIHTCSHPDLPFVPSGVWVDKDSMFLDSLFGHVRGAFTGAMTNRKGLVESAGQGTLFLDEIHNCPRDQQGALLRFLREREYFPLGTDQVKKANCSIVAASNQPLHALSPDFAIRLNVLTIVVPPLRERKEEIPHLVKYFLKSFGKQHNRIIDITPTAIAYLCNLNWQFNVAELQNVIERAGLQAGDLIDDQLIREAIMQPDLKPQNSNLTHNYVSLEDVEKNHIGIKIAESKSISEAARKLGISRTTLYEKIRLFNLTHLLLYRKNR